MKIIAALILLLVSSNISAQNLSDKKTQRHSKTDTLTEAELSKFNKYIDDHLKYPNDARDLQIIGLLIATYKVDADNKIQDINIIRSPSECLSNALINMLKGSAPPSLKTKNIIYALPLYFTLGENESGRNIEKYHPPVYDDELSKLLYATTILFTEHLIRGYIIHY